MRNARAVAAWICRSMASSVGEDAATYDLLRDELVQHYQPQSILQWMDIKHLQDAIWEIFRLNRMKSAVINCDRKAALKSHDDALSI